MRRALAWTLGAAATAAVGLGVWRWQAEDAWIRVRGGYGLAPPDDFPGSFSLEGATRAGAVVVVADVQAVERAAADTRAWGRAHLEVAEVLAGSELAEGAAFSVLFLCDAESHRGYPDGWDPCPDRTRRYLLTLERKDGAWRAVTHRAHPTRDELAAVRTGLELRPGALPTGERLRRLTEAGLSADRGLRWYAVTQLRHDPAFERDAAARALLDVAARTSDHDPRWNALDAAADRLHAHDQPPTETDALILGAIARGFLAAREPHEPGRAFQTLYHALRPGIDPAIRARVCEARLGVLRAQGLDPERLAPAIRKLGAMSGPVGGEPELLAALEGRPAPGDGGAP